MTVDGLSASSPSWAIDSTRVVPPSVTIDDVETIRDRVSEECGAVPKGLETIIANFADAAGRNGTMTFAQFKAFAADNGVVIGRGDISGRARPGGGGRPAPTPGGGMAAGSSSRHSGAVANATNGKLTPAAASGDAQAIRELQGLEAGQGQGISGETVSSVGMLTSPKVVGTIIDVYV